MKTKYFLSITILFMLIFSCKKTEDSPTPVPTPTPIPTPSFSGCRISQYSQDVIDDPVITFLIKKFKYDKDGFIINTETAYKRNNTEIGTQTSKMSFKDGLLAQFSDAGLIHIENYQYLNGALSSIKIPSSDTPSLVNFEIKITTDADKRIIKMEDNYKNVTVIKRDAKGNIIEIKVTDEVANEVFKMEFSSYDNKKTIYELMKGFQFDSFADANTYMEKPFFSVGASGNPLKAKVYRKGILKEDLEFTYDYTAEGYPTKITSTNILFNKVITQTIEYEGCK